MKLGSHDTMTYLPVKQWYFKPFHFTARCQSKSVYEQIENHGVELIDIRIRFGEDCQPWFAHGPIMFNGYKHNANLPTDVFDWFADYSIKHKLKDKLYCRVILEMNHKMKDQDKQEELFKEYCKYIQELYKDWIYFFGGQRKYDWKKVYDFGTIEPTLDDKYSSTTSLFKSTGWKWLDNVLMKIDDLWPWLYARINNHKNIKKGTDKDYLFIDFIGELS